MSRVISIILYAFSGFFLYCVSVVAFVGGDIPLVGKLIIMGVFCIPTVVILVIGLAVTEFRDWKRDTGIVFLGASGFAVFAILTIACVALDPEFTDMFPDTSFDLFSDYTFGTTVLVLLSLTGYLLIISAKRSKKVPNTCHVSQCNADP